MLLFAKPRAGSSVLYQLLQMWTLLLLLQLCTLPLQLGSASAVAPVPAVLLQAQLLQTNSTRPCTAVRIDQASVPPNATWFRLRGVSKDWAFPVLCDSFPHCARGLAAEWFVRTAASPQEHSFYGTEPTYLYLHRRTVNTFVVEAWSKRNDLGDGGDALLLGTSAPLRFSFDDRGFAAGVDLGEFRATTLGPGEVTISAHPVKNEAFGMVEVITWSAFRPTGTTTVGNTSRPAFTFDEGLLFEDFSPRQYTEAAPEHFIHLNVSVSAPGVYFIGVFAVWNGVYGYTVPAPENGVNAGSFPQVLDSTTGTKLMQPLAVVVPWENGSLPALPAGFLGAIHTTPPIPGDQRLALDSHAITVFDGGSVWIRLAHNAKCGDGCVGPSASVPTVIELEVPRGMQILPFIFGSAEGAMSGFANVTDVTSVPGGGAVNEGYVRLRLDKAATWQWGVYNRPKLQFVVAAELNGRTFSQARIRGYSSPSGQHRADNWQVLQLRAEELQPVPAVPRRLHTAYCWATPPTFARDAQTWKAL